MNLFSATFAIQPFLLYKIVTKIVCFNLETFDAETDVIRLTEKLTDELVFETNRRMVPGTVLNRVILLQMLHNAPAAIRTCIPVAFELSIV